MFLSDDELKKLTGRVQHTAQVRWLRRQGFRFTVNALGDPVVAIAEANRKLVGGATRERQAANLDALNGSAAKTQ